MRASYVAVYAGSLQQTHLIELEFRDMCKRALDNVVKAHEHHGINAIDHGGAPAIETDRSCI